MDTDPIGDKAGSATISTRYTASRSLVYPSPMHEDNDNLWEIARQMADVAHDLPGVDEQFFMGVKRRRRRWWWSSRRREMFDRGTWSKWLLDMGWVSVSQKDIVTRRCWEIQNRLVSSGLVHGVHSEAREPVPLIGWTDRDRIRANRHKFRIAQHVYTSSKCSKQELPFPACAQPIFSVADDEQTLYRRRVGDKSFHDLLPSSKWMVGSSTESYPAILRESSLSNKDMSKRIHFVMQGETMRSRTYYRNLRQERRYRHLLHRYGSHANIAAKTGIHDKRRSLLVAQRIGVSDLSDARHV